MAHHYDVVVLGAGFAGIDNLLFYADAPTMVFGDAEKSVTEVADELKARSDLGETSTTQSPTIDLGVQP